MVSESEGLSLLSRRDRLQDDLFVAGSLRDLIPDDHVLVRLDRVLDLSWLYDEVKGFYDLEKGRPGIDAEVALRLMLSGLVLGVVHDRALLRQAQVDLSIRWFIGYRLDEKLPDHSSLSVIRKRWGPALFARLFARTVGACVEAGLVKGRDVHVDATLIRADVSWDSLALRHAARVGEANGDGEAERGGGGDSGGDSAPGGRPRKLSSTDPEARMATSRRDHRLEPSYKQLTAVDGAHGVQVDAQVIGADRHEGGSLIEQLARVEGLTGQITERVTADAAYASAANFAALEERGTEAVIALPRVRRAKLPAARFKYDGKHDLVRCPAGRKLTPRGRAGKDGRYYRARAKDCSHCRWRQICLPKTAGARTIMIKDGHGALMRARRRQRRQLPEDIAARNRHRGLVEGIHGEAKARHGLGRAMRRGLWNVRIQAWLTAAVINLKRLAKARLCAILKGRGLTPLEIALQAALKAKITNSPNLVTVSPPAA